MELSTFAFWILFALLLFAIFLMITISIFSQIQKKRLEMRLEEVFFEVRELNLRVTIVETRMEERSGITISPAVSPPQLGTPAAPKKRGRPKKISQA